MINVIGLGYIGLPTALMMTSHGVEVIGTVSRWVPTGARCIQVSSSRAISTTPTPMCLAPTASTAMVESAFQKMLMHLPR